MNNLTYMLGDGPVYYGNYQGSLSSVVEEGRARYLRFRLGSRCDERRGPKRAAVSDSSASSYLREFEMGY